MSQPLDFVVAIPARYAASRLPGKPLRLLGGQPLVLRVPSVRCWPVRARCGWPPTTPALPMRCRACPAYAWR